METSGEVSSQGGGEQEFGDGEAVPAPGQEDQRLQERCYSEAGAELAGSPAQTGQCPGASELGELALIPLPAADTGLLTSEENGVAGASPPLGDRFSATAIGNVIRRF